MSKKNEKLESLYNYLLENGFNHSVSDIAQGIQVTTMTLYNRYKTRDELEKQVLDFWQLQFQNKYNHKRQYANNAVELLLLFIYELMIARDHEKYFFEKERKNNMFLDTDKNCFIKMVESILKRGVEEKVFLHELELPLYATFFMHNIVYLVLLDEIPNVDYVNYVISSILTEQGRVTFNMINLQNFFYNS